MNPTQPETPAFESDSRFPSGPWTGYFLQPSLPGKHWMELMLTFREGVATGEGRDWVGDFRIKGQLPGRGRQVSVDQGLHQEARDCLSRL